MTNWRREEHESGREREREEARPRGYEGQPWQREAAQGPWSSEHDRERSFGAHPRRDYGGAPFARGQELQDESDAYEQGGYGGMGPYGSAPHPGSYGRQSRSPTSSTYSGRGPNRSGSYGPGDADDERSGDGWQRDSRSESGRGSRQDYGFRQYGSRQQRGSEPRTGRYAGVGPKGYQRSDERIKEEISDRLMQDPDIDASSIEVEVSNGEVTLSGTVDSRNTKWQLECLADDTPGVKEVENKVRVTRATGRSREGEQSSASSSSSQSSAQGASGSSASRSAGSTGSSRTESNPSVSRSKGFSGSAGSAG